MLLCSGFNLHILIYASSDDKHFLMSIFQHVSSSVKCLLKYFLPVLLGEESPFYYLSVAVFNIL